MEFWLELRVNETGGVEVYNFNKTCPVCYEELDFENSALIPKHDKLYDTVPSGGLRVVPHGGIDDGEQVQKHKKLYDIAAMGELWVHGDCMEKEEFKHLISFLERLEEIEVGR